jgi:hypothetical protein
MGAAMPVVLRYSPPLTLPAFRKTAFYLYRRSLYQNRASLLALALLLVA